jgi:hypothetical protein
VSFILSVIMLSVVYEPLLLSVAMLTVVMLSVVAPQNNHIFSFDFQLLLVTTQIQAFPMIDEWIISTECKN